MHFSCRDRTRKLFRQSRTRHTTQAALALGAGRARARTCIVHRDLRLELVSRPTGTLSERIQWTAGARSGHLDVELALPPRIIISDISIGNAEWAGKEPLAVLRELMFSVSVPSLFTNKIVLPHVRLTGGEVNLLRDKDGRANWQLRKSDQPSTRTFDVQSLALIDASLSYRDAIQNIDVQARGESRRDGPYEQRMTFGGKWRGNPFEGTADVGNVLSLRDLRDPFPLRLALRFARTSINAEGHVADIRNLSHIDAKVSMSGPSLGTLYPTLPLALPETPPYRVTGRLVREGEVYTYTGFSSVIGNTDLAGDARYERRTPRPLLTATLKSRSLDLADLGPLVGLPPRTECEHTAGRAQGHADTRESGAGKAAAGKSVPERRFQCSETQCDGRRCATHCGHAENSRADSARKFFYACEAQRRGSGAGSV